MKGSPPKVSIGMPVYNGEHRIKNALDSLLRQTFRDFNVIVSDNASSDKTPDICKMYGEKDNRIRYVRQQENIGPFHNFLFVLNQSEGEFFMWAAHDDEWEPRFIEKILEEFDKADDSVVAIGSEAQYTVNSEKQEFFPEGKAFYSTSLNSSYLRIRHMLKFNYGNLFYSVFSTSVLKDEFNRLSKALKSPTLNEIPLFLVVASRGNWKILPEVLFFKETFKGRYLQARWEMEGGLLPPIRIGAFVRKTAVDLLYHVSAVRAVLRALSLVDISMTEQLKLRGVVVYSMAKHFLILLTRRKKVVN